MSEEIGGQAGATVYTRIAQVVVAAPAATVDFSAVPATCENLRIVATLRGDTAATQTTMLMRFNNDSAANYDWQQWRANGTGLAGTTGVGVTELQAILYMAAGSAPAGRASMLTMDIPNYARTALFKMFSAHASLSQGTAAGDQAAMHAVGTWRSTVAINRVTLIPGAGNFDVGTVVTLYGVN